MSGGAPRVAAPAAKRVAAVGWRVRSPALATVCPRRPESGGSGEVVESIRRGQFLPEADDVRVNYC
mgnify:CR=1 FL=1